MVQEILRRITDDIETFLRQAGITEPVVFLDRTAQAEFGDYFSNVAMRYSKDLQKKPVELAEELAAFLKKQNTELIEKATAVAPGFLNIYLSVEAKIKHLNYIREMGDLYGHNKQHVDEKWVIEHTSPNPNKAMHLGHLRNNLIGMGIVRLLKTSGAEVVSDAVYNNRGIAIAKLMYGYLAHMKKEVNIPTDIEYWCEHPTEWYLPEEKEMKPDLFVSHCYVLAEKDISNSQEIEQLVRQMVIDWEAKDKSTWKLWNQVLEFAYSGINQTLNRLGSYWDNIWYEHEHYQKGKDYVEIGLQKNIFRKLDDGAVLTDIESKYKIPDTILLKNDGTSLYITQDIALTDLKIKKYGADKMVWVVGPEQSLAMRQLFAVCEQLGIGKYDDFTHVTYGYVGLRDGQGGFKKMSSREGTVVLIDDVVDEVKETIIKRFQDEGRHGVNVQDSLSEKLAIAAVKFSFLRSDRTQDLSFDIEQSIDVQGDSGMYVMYTYVRTQSILRKAGAGILKLDQPTVFQREASLVQSLLHFEEVIMRATSDLSPHHVSQYLLELSSEFNSWYGQETILDGSDRQNYKLAVVDAVAITLRNGLGILGIEVVDEI